MINSLASDMVAFGYALNRIFWDVVDETHQTRSRLRLRQGLSRLAEQQTHQYERLGRMGFELLRDGVAVERTPETAKVLSEIDRLQADQGRFLERRGANLSENRSPFPWQRLERGLRSGDSVVHVTALPDSSPWCGRPMASGAPAGVCIAFRRGRTIRPMTPETTCVGGDLLIVLSPAASVPDWDRWLTSGSWTLAGEGSQQN